MGWIRRFRNTLWGSAADADFAEEAQFHLEERTREYVAQGRNPDEARREARRRLGNLTSARDYTRDVDTFRWLTDLRQDTRHALRGLARAPSFTIAAVLTLMFGIGANTAMFSVVNTYFFRSLPYPHADRLIRVFRTSKESQSWPHSVANFLDYQRRNQVFEHLTAFTGIIPVLAERGEAAERLQGVAVTSDFFRALGTPPVLGRLFATDEDRPGGDGVAILSYRFWWARFGGDPHIVGRRLRLDGLDTKVVGVMPAGFEHPLLWGRVDLWQPLAFTDAQRQNRGNNYLQAFGLLRPGVTVSEAATAMARLATNLSADTKSNQLESLRLEPLQRSMSDDIGRRAMWLTFGLAGCVLLIACVNIANLQLVRAVARSREQTIRAALGAGRFRLVRQSLTESLVLALGGGMLSLVVAITLVQFMNVRLFATLPGAGLSVDTRVFLFALAASLVTGLLFGLAPAFYTSPASLDGALRGALHGGATSLGGRLRSVLVGGEVAFALILLVGGGLFLRGLQRFTHADPGWSVDGLATAQLNLQGPSYATPEQRRVFYGVLEEHLRALPGIQQVAISRSQPPAFGFGTSGGILLEGKPDPGPGLYPEAFVELVNGEYFETLGIRLVGGRLFGVDDIAGHPPVAVVNEAMARQLWPNDTAIGKRISAANPTARNWIQIVGVVNDLSFPASLSEPYTRFVLFRPLTQAPVGGINLTVRTALDPEAAGQTLRRTVAALDPTQPLDEVRTARSLVDEGLGPLSLLASLLGAFATLGLILVALGIYGLTSYLVVQRTKELALRMALGANASDVIREVLSRGLRVTAYGTVVGAAGAYAIARVLAAIIPTLPSHDPLLSLVLTVGLVLVAMIACYVPARRATTIEPLVALREG